ncbi:hypothetical protein [Sphaerimonospora mesophila]|uniref:hypothetical protein n=1 Tax=Sphaerimonospora mesophila TaxID=37483 RepID=UPI0006E3BB6C
MAKTTRQRRRSRQRWEAARAYAGARERREAARARAEAQEQRLTEEGSSSTGKVGANLFAALGMLMLLFALVGIPFLIFGSTLPEVQTALGMKGTPGTATVLSCETHRSHTAVLLRPPGGIQDDEDRSGRAGGGHGPRP